MQLLAKLWEGMGWDGLGAIVGLVALAGIPIAVFAPSLYQMRRQVSYRVIYYDPGLHPRTRDLLT
jgi:hypothetical protein